MHNTFEIPLITDIEPERLAALRRYCLIGTEAEKSFITIAKTVSAIFNVGIAMISLVEDENVHFKSSVGMATEIGPRGESFCALTVLTQEINVIEDACTNPVVCNNPLVSGSFGLRFYAGAPLITHDKFMIGTVCIVDTQPRTFSNQDREILVNIAKIVMEQIELRLVNMQAAHTQHAINRALVISNDKIAASEKRFQRLLDTMAEGVAMTTVNGKFIYVNLMAQRIFGLSEAEMLNRSCNDPVWNNCRIDGSPLPDEEHPMTMVIENGHEVYDFEINVKMPGRESFYISVNAAAITDEQGTITGGIATFMDVTHRRRILQQKDEFISIASHELKTPVTSLKASVEILDRIKDDSAPQIWATMIFQAKKSLDKLTVLITDLLDANLISKGQLELRKTFFSMAEMINFSCINIRNGGTHEIELSGDPHLHVFADEHKIDQVIVNLVNNAVKYAPDSKKIEIHIEKQSDIAKVSIIDNGPGIPAENIPYLFQRYYRVNNTGERGSGLGLGLYISAEIIKKHNGHCGVESEHGRGARFWFTLPLSN